MSARPLVVRRRWIHYSKCYWRSELEWLGRAFAALARRGFGWQARIAEGHGESLAAHMQVESTLMSRCDQGSGRDEAGVSLRNAQTVENVELLWCS